MNYIPVDKLIVEIEKLSDCRERPEFNQMEEDAYSCAIDEIKNLIDSLQQEMWKPSEEQIKEYGYWYRNFIKSGLASPTSKAVSVLGELLEQLKLL